MFSPALINAPNDFTLGLYFTGAALNRPGAIAIDSQGNAWIGSIAADVVKLSPSGTYLSPVSGFQGNGIFSSSDIAIDQHDNVWIAAGSDLVKLTNTGTPISPALPPGTSASWSSPDMINCGTSGLAIDVNGNAWLGVVGLGCGSISEFSPIGAVLSKNGFTSADLYQPYGLSFDGAGNVWVTNADHLSMSEFNSLGVSLSAPSGFNTGDPYPGGVAVDSAGNVWSPFVSFNDSSSLKKFNHAGLIQQSYQGGGLATPVGIAIDGLGNLWIANGPDTGVSHGTGSVSEFTSAGVAVSPATGFAPALATYPDNIAIDGSGNVWVPIGNINIYNDHTVGQGGVVELIGAAAPVIVPKVAALPATPTADGSSLLGTRP